MFIWRPRGHLNREFEPQFENMSVSVLPGDLVIPESVRSKKLKLGPGLVEHSSNAILATRAGTLHSKHRTTFYIDSDTKRVSDTFIVVIQLIPWAVCTCIF